MSKFFGTVISISEQPTVSSLWEETYISLGFVVKQKTTIQIFTASEVLVSP
jgi:hypothetical protein